MSNRKQRNSSIELLRIIAEIGVILLHYNLTIEGGLSGLNNDINRYYYYFVESIFICAVNLFVIISSYYLSDNNKRKLSKVFNLLFEVIFFKVIFYLINVFVIQENTFKVSGFVFSFLPASYFFILYSVLYIISPYINELGNKLTKKQYEKMLAIMFIIFSVYSFSVDLIGYFKAFHSLSPIGNQGSQMGYTIVNFVLLYLIGFYIRKYGINLSKKKTLLYYAITLLALYISSLILDVGGQTWNYNNPLVIIMAVLTFLLFNTKEFYNPVINSLSKAAFTCFLTHGFFLDLLSSHIRKIVVNGNVFLAIIDQIGTGLVLYLVAYLIHIVYSKISKFAVKPISTILDKIDIYSLNSKE